MKVVGTIWSADFTDDYKTFDVVSVGVGSRLISVQPSTRAPLYLLKEGVEQEGGELECVWNDRSVVCNNGS